MCRVPVTSKCISLPSQVQFGCVPVVSNDYGLNGSGITAGSGVAPYTVVARVTNRHASPQ